MRLMVYAAGVGMVAALTAYALAAGAQEVTPAASSEEYASLDQMPVGTLQIKDCGNGLLNVKARCVPAQRFIDELGKHLGKPTRPDAPLQNYFTVWAQDDQRTPQAWLDYAIGVNACAGLSDQGAFWRIGWASARPGAYDPSATEASLLNAPSESAPATVTPEAGIQEGLYFYKGQLLPPPYRVELEYADNSVSVALNGVALERFEEPAPPLNNGESDALYEIPASVATVPELIRVGGKICHNVAKQGGTWEQARLAVLTYLQQQSFVEIADVSDPLILICDKRRGPGRSNAIPPDCPHALFGPDAGRGDSVRPSALDSARKFAQNLENSLRSDSVIVNSGAGNVGFNGEVSVAHFRDVVLGNCSLLAKECLLCEVLHDRDMARQLVVEMHVSAIALTPALDALVERVRAGAAKARDDALREISIEAAIQGSLPQ